MAAAGNTSEKRLSLKLVFDMKAKKVIFAEAGNEFVDFIFQILSLPLSTVTKVLSDNNMEVGSLGALCNSVKHLSAKRFKPNVNEDSVLIPKSNACVPLLAVRTTPLKFYLCPRQHTYLSDRTDMICPSCLNYFGSSKPYTYISTASSSNDATGPAYVNGDMTYLVTDNLEVKAMSFTNMKSLVRDIDSLEEKEVEVGVKEGVAILKASLEGNAVLTATFLKKILAPTDNKPRVPGYRVHEAAN